MYAISARSPPMLPWRRERDHFAVIMMSFTLAAPSFSLPYFSRIYDALGRRQGKKLFHPALNLKLLLLLMASVCIGNDKTEESVCERRYP